MSLLLAPSNQNFLLSTSTDLVPKFAAGQFGICTWIKIPATLASPQTIYDSDSNGVDSSQAKLVLNVNRTLSLTITNSTGTFSIYTTPVFNAPSPGWHIIYSYRVTGGAYRISADTTVLKDFPGGTFLDAPLSRIQIGRSFGGNDQLDAQLLYFSSITGVIGPTQLAQLFNNGVPISPALTPVPTNAVLPFINDDVATTGVVAIGSGRQPEFVDDSDITGSWTPSAYDLMPAIRNGNVLFDNANYDLLMFSDSFGVPSTARLSQHLANELARESSAPFKKLMQGYKTTFSTSGNPIVSSVSMSGTQVVSDTNTYQWENNNTPVRLALPLDDGIEVPVNPFVDAQTLLDVTISNPSVYTGPLSSWIGAGDVIRATPILRKSTVVPLLQYRTIDGISSSPRDDTLVGNTGLATAQQSKDLTVDVSGSRKILFGPESGAWSTSTGNPGDYFQFVGLVADNLDTTKGIGFGAVGDSSWSVIGHAVNTSSSAGQPKQYSDAEIEVIINAFHTPGRKLILALSIATEFNMQTNIEAFVSRMEIRCANLGITNFSILLISQFTHVVGGVPNLVTNRGDVRNSALAMDAVAAGNPNVAHVSIYKLTDGCFFHNAGQAGFDPNDANGPQQKFLEDYDAAHSTTYAVTPGRVMLDANSIHLGSSPAAQFMAEVAAREVVANSIQEPPSLIENYRSSTVYIYTPFVF